MNGYNLLYFIRLSLLENRNPGQKIYFAGGTRIGIYPGQYYDAETGLHYNWHRYYDPETGRYLRPDPIGLAGGINLFAYVQNDPVNLIDPLGTDPYSTIKGIVDVVSIIDVLPIGAVPGSGQVIGQILDMTAGVGTVGVLTAELDKENITWSQYIIANSLNATNMIIGTFGNVTSGTGNLVWVWLFCDTNKMY